LSGYNLVRHAHAAAVDGKYLSRYCRAFVPSKQFLETGIAIEPIKIMGFLKKSALRHRDDKRTRAAELTLRESIYPLCLVTILFFLWASRLYRGPIQSSS
jgi:hypothetical protein